MFCSKCRIGLWAFSGDTANNISALPSHEPLIWTNGLEQKLLPCLKLKTIIYYLCKDTEVIKKNCKDLFIPLRFIISNCHRTTRITNLKPFLAGIS